MLAAACLSAGLPGDVNGEEKGEGRGNTSEGADGVHDGGIGGVDVRLEGGGLVVSVRRHVCLIVVWLFGCLVV